MVGSRLLSAIGFAASLLTALSVVTAATVYLLECDDRAQERQLRAWQILQATEGVEGANPARTRALEALVAVGADLEGVDLEGADLSGADLECARFKAYRTELTGVDLSNANLRGAEFVDGGLTMYVDVEGADLRGARFRWNMLDDLEGLSQEQLDSLCIIDRSPIDKRSREKLEKRGLSVPDADPAYCGSICE